MTRDEFCNHYWSYYIALEKDFLLIERYVRFEMGNNCLYDRATVTDYGNSTVYSDELIKQYLSICSEVDVILKSICIDLGDSVSNSMPGYTETVLTQWPSIIGERVKIRNMELIPFMNWSRNPYASADWWTPYNNVKHQRLTNYKEANLKNVLNALSGLYLLETYYVRYIGQRDNVRDVANDVSKLFEIENFETKDKVIGYESYLIRADEIEAMFIENSE